MSQKLSLRSFNTIYCTGDIGSTASKRDFKAVSRNPLILAWARLNRGGSESVHRQSKRAHLPKAAMPSISLACRRHRNARKSKTSFLRRACIQVHTSRLLCSLLSSPYFLALLTPARTSQETQRCCRYGSRKCLLASSLHSCVLVLFS